MEPKNDPLDDLDRLILEALKEKPDRDLSLSFTDTLLLKAERRLRWQELLREFTIKVGIALGSLGLVALLLVFMASEVSGPFLSMVAVHWQLVTGFGLLVLFAFFSDQVLLRMFSCPPHGINP
jgi:hypothetical protein